MDSKIVLLSIFESHLYAITLNDEGFYCGYVRFEDDEKYLFEKAGDEYNKTCDVSFIKCHGGVTFVSHENGDWILPAGNWVGFDCAHSRDGRDFILTEKIFGKKKAEIARENYYDDGKNLKITMKMVADVCKDIVEQIIEMKNAK